jgi:hypothetical protein
VERLPKVFERVLLRAEVHPGAPRAFVFLPLVASLTFSVQAEHHFRFDPQHPGFVFCQRGPDDQEWRKVRIVQVGSCGGVFSEPQTHTLCQSGTDIAQMLKLIKAAGYGMLSKDENEVIPETRKVNLNKNMKTSSATFMNDQQQREYYQDMVFP